MNPKMPWFRFYGEAVDDEKLRLLDFGDRWQFVALLCLKSQGVLDEPSDPLLRRKVAVKLGVDMATLDEIARRLADVGLIDQESLQPVAWDNRQYQSDSSKDRTRAYRERQRLLTATKKSQERHGDGGVTAQDTDTDTDTDKETDTEEKHISIKPKKNPAMSRPDSVNETIWRDFLTHRKSLNAPVSTTVLAGFEREAKKAGVSLEDAIRISIERGWRGFRASWELEKPSVPAKPKMDEKTKHYLRLTGRAHLIDKEVVDV